MRKSTSLFTQLFARFLKSRRTRHLFRRRVILESLPRKSRAEALPDLLNRQLVQQATQDLPSLLARLGSRQQGLSPREAAAIRARVGPNEVEHEKPMPWWLHLWLSYKNPFNLLLTALAVLSYATRDIKAALVIGCMVALSTLIRFVQERRSSQAVQALKELVSNKATVIRRGNAAAKTAANARRPAAAGPGMPTAGQVELPIRQLVPGDIVRLSAGDMIPADCRVMVAKDLFVSQSAMTGESLPVEKFPEATAQSQGALEMASLVFMGTNVVSGSATVLVLATGNSTYFGTLATRVTAATPEVNAFQVGVNKVSWLLIRFALVMVPVVFLINGLTKGDWIQAFLFALSIAVGLTPEMLPMIVTSTLAKGAVILSRQKVIVKQLDAIQNFGAMNVLCTDKTGTLTQDKIALARHTDVFGRDSEEVLGLAYLNSYYQTGLKSLLDRAVLEHAEVPQALQLAENYSKIDEIPFDFQRRRMSVVVSERSHHHELICKGAVEEVVAICTHARDGGNTVPLDAAMLERAHRVTREFNERGLRVVAVAMKEIPPSQEVYSVADESALTLIGYIAFLDPPKESTAPALKALAASGVTLKVLTGDNELVTAEVCRQVGLAVKGVMLGAQLDTLDDKALAGAVEQHTIFAKLSPLHKERIVRSLRSNGHVVGFMGDGINDAPALRAADIGISVDSAVDIAKEAADIILLEHSLMVLAAGVIEGRKTFSNMLKYIRMTASSNFGNVFSVLIASLFLPFLPMLPLQLLVQNLLYDVSQIAIPFDNVDAELVSQPLRWNPDDMGRFMVYFGPISSIFDIATFAVMWYVFKANSVAQQTLFQSGWFVVGLLTQTLIVHMIRTPKIPFIESRAAWPLTAMTLFIMAAGIILPMGPLASYFKLQALPLAYFGWLATILLGYAVLTTLMKRYYIRRFGWQ
ncbi:magnesium-translocating P-type ATPase [Polaromonas sp.]|uniref:magnesium-translocating P-type ATPase n=1 Tax=Polaromonas sp. TaxID=1869339 RepID=UPI003BB776CC